MVENSYLIRNSWSLPTITNLTWTLSFHALNNTWAKFNNWTVKNSDVIRIVYSGIPQNKCMCSLNWHMHMQVYVIISPFLPPLSIPSSLSPGCSCLGWSDGRSLSRVRLNWKRFWLLLDSHTYMVFLDRKASNAGTEFPGYLPTWKRIIITGKLFAWSRGCE